MCKNHDLWLRDFSTKTYGFELNSVEQTVGFRSNALLIRNGNPEIYFFGGYAKIANLFFSVIVAVDYNVEHATAGVCYHLAERWSI